jgi:hypothetical protein
MQDKENDQLIDDHFGKHEHTLIALTRVEVCVLPLQEIALSNR